MNTKEFLKVPTLRIPMQYFADPGDESNGKDEAKGGEEGKEEQKTPSFDDVLSNKAYQSEFDKRVAKALESAKSKWDAEEKARAAEAEKMAKMDAEKKAAYEREKAEKALAEREAVVTRRELKAGAIDILVERELPVEIAELLNYSSEEARNESLEKTIASVNKIAEAIAVKRQRGAVPKAGNPNTGKPYDGMSIDELSARLNEHPNERDDILSAIRERAKK